MVKKSYLNLSNNFQKLRTTSNPKNSDTIFNKVYGISEIEMVEQWKKYYKLIEQ